MDELQKIIKLYEDDMSIYALSDKSAELSFNSEKFRNDT